MSKGIQRYMKALEATLEAARIIGEAMEKAREVLKAAKVDDVEGTIGEILEADEQE